MSTFSEPTAGVSLQRAIDLESGTALTETERELLTGRSGHPLTWQAYHSLADHHRFLDFIAANYVGLCEAFSIGHSTEGRDLKGIKCGLGKSEEAKKEIWIDGGKLLQTCKKAGAVGMVCQ